MLKLETKEDAFRFLSTPIKEEASIGFKNKVIDVSVNMFLVSTTVPVLGHRSYREMTFLVQ